VSAVGRSATVAKRPEADMPATSGSREGLAAGGENLTLPTAIGPREHGMFTG
jgi:hypothetical protein